MELSKNDSLNKKEIHHGNELKKLAASMEITAEAIQEVLGFKSSQAVYTLYSKKQIKKPYLGFLCYELNMDPSVFDLELAAVTNKQFQFFSLDDRMTAEETVESLHQLAFESVVNAKKSLKVLDYVPAKRGVPIEAGAMISSDTFNQYMAAHLESLTEVCRNNIDNDDFRYVRIAQIPESRHPINLETMEQFVVNSPIYSLLHIKWCLEYFADKSSIYVIDHRVQSYSTMVIDGHIVISDFDRYVGSMAMPDSISYYKKSGDDYKNPVNRVVRHEKEKIESLLKTNSADYNIRATVTIDLLMRVIQSALGKIKAEYDEITQIDQASLGRKEEYLKIIHDLENKQEVLKEET